MFITSTVNRCTPSIEWQGYCNKMCQACQKRNLDARSAAKVRYWQCQRLMGKDELSVNLLYSLLLAVSQTHTQHIPPSLCAPSLSLSCSQSNSPINLMPLEPPALWSHFYTAPSYACSLCVWMDIYIAFCLVVLSTLSGPNHTCLCVRMWVCKPS